MESKVKNREWVKDAAIVFLAVLLLSGIALAEEAAAKKLLIAQNDRLSLFLSPDLCSIDIQDALTGKTWSSTMNDETAEGLRIIPAQQKRITSLLAVNCICCKAVWVSHHLVL